MFPPGVKYTHATKQSGIGRPASTGPTCWPFTTQRIPHAPTPAAQRSPAETHTAHPPGDAQAHTRMHIHSVCAKVGSTGKTIMQPEEGQACLAEAVCMVCATSTDAISRPIAGNWLTHSGMESQKRRQQRDQRAAGCRCKPGPAPAKAGGHASRFCIGQGSRSTWDINQRRDVMAWAIKSAPCPLFGTLGDKQGAVLMVKAKA